MIKPAYFAKGCAKPYPCQYKKAKFTQLGFLLRRSMLIKDHISFQRFWLSMMTSFATYTPKKPSTLVVPGFFRSL